MYLITAQGHCSTKYGCPLLGILSRLNTEFQNIVYDVKSYHYKVTPFHGFYRCLNYICGHSIAIRTV